MKLSVLMPVYNEEKTIEEIIQRVLAQPMVHELIVVDDGSQDGTREVLRALNDERVKVFFKARNEGKGAALKEAAQQATGDVSIIQDADLEYDPQEYSAMLDLLVSGKADVVYGSRFLYRTRIYNFYHLLGNKVINLLVNMLFNTTFTDMETCYKAFRTDYIKDMTFQSKSFGFEVEFTAHMVKKKLRIYEVPISYYGRTYEEGKKITWRDGLKALYWIIYCRFF